MYRLDKTSDGQGGKCGVNSLSSSLYKGERDKTWVFSTSEIQHCKQDQALPKTDCYAKEQLPALLVIYVLEAVGKKKKNNHQTLKYLYTVHS